MSHIEVKIDGDWQQAPLVDGWKYDGLPMRCPSCHGGAYIMRSHIEGGSPYLVHKRKWDGCHGGDPLPKHQHPKPLE